MTIKREYIAASSADMDEMDVESIYWEHGDNFVVYNMETRETWSPVFCYRENGDMDGFMGWN